MLQEHFLCRLFFIETGTFPAWVPSRSLGTILSSKQPFMLRNTSLFSGLISFHCDATWCPGLSGIFLLFSFKLPLRVSLAKPLPDFGGGIVITYSRPTNSRALRREGKEPADKMHKGPVHKQTYGNTEATLQSRIHSLHRWAPQAGTAGTPPGRHMSHLSPTWSQIPPLSHWGWAEVACIW